MSVKSDVVKPLTSRSGQAVLEMLPVDQKTLRIAEKVLQPKNLKRIAIVARRRIRAGLHCHLACSRPAL